MEQSNDATINSEFRQDPVSGAWVDVALRRETRPHQTTLSKENCPFEDPEKSNHVSASVTLPDEGKSDDWFVKIVPNKFPAVGKHDICPVVQVDGPFAKMAGSGFHDIVITRDHEKDFVDFSTVQTDLVLRAFQERYNQVKHEECIQYVSMFHNHGRSAGASIPHPHSQMIALPIIPPDVKRSLDGSSAYFQQKRICVHCLVIEYELKGKNRIIYQNDDAVVLCPFASQQNYEVRIFPKKHQAFFEDAKENRAGIAEALNIALSQIKNKLNDPDYNFFIHTAPTHRTGWDHYHWHIEIQPKLNIWAGFELGTGIEIITVSPEEAASILRIK